MADRKRFTRARVKKAVDDIVSRLKRSRARAQVLGGYARGNDTVKDVDILTSMPLAKVIEVLELKKESRMSGGDRRMHFKYDGVPIDMFYATRDEWPYQTLYLNGDHMFNIIIRSHAKKLGYLLSQYGIFNAHDRTRARGSAAIKTERQIFKYLNFPWRAVTERNYARR
jgi:DNA polymerase/3'-5' exonuclease PolX